MVIFCFHNYLFVIFTGGIKTVNEKYVANKEAVKQVKMGFFLKIALEFMHMDNVAVS